MDKNIGEQLNKAYEAYRQACMDRDSAIKELQQKQTENYEQRIREQQEQLSLQQTIIDKLKSQLLLVNSSRDNSYGCVPLREDSEAKKNNLTLDEPHEKGKSGIPRENESKVRRQEISSPRKEASPRSLGIHSFHERGSIEKTFRDLKEEFHRICMLAKAQKDHLSKLNVPTTATETQCSVPIQCTDKTDKQEVLFKPQAKDDINRGAPCITSVTPRGLARDEEDNSVESLSKFNVKFPPTDSDSTFLHSTPERPNVLGPTAFEAVCQDTFNMEPRDNPGNFVKTEETLFDIQGIELIASATQNLKTTDKTKPSSLVNTCIRTTLDRAPCLPPADHNKLCINTFPLQDPSDAPFTSLDSPGKAIRGPQQPIWKPFPNQDSDLSVLSGTGSELRIPRVCEFCQAVFPPSITSRGDFLRHLNSHFNGET
ncbi:TRAF family member-associated NF-kappa-B activator isoform X3 [Camelus dromedarius]|nr:TRAF family member-associated NF-kappa-B activator isoform X3 [Camelus dromedarius]XP_031307392.1 TRAF family member-associated NF-kappa-B activator isoform X3 [Camelus dromedarius]XP_031307393.1 TRAF family member-associated NF-kappa-B activator isoform X3 [Camelus dromedarius]XP_031307394.1 TRAF family member-associated NF-kappa-B activator isoform X3 [Camelus dromedarius]XP_031307395.1 TRAF family member-associated NF-kappa-B activator isoform X3 [Camelus dromedarius]